MPDEAHNRRAWNKLSGPGCPWSIPAGDNRIAAARRGEFEVTIAGPRAVPREWLGDPSGQAVLCLGAGGGQQAPVLAAAGYHVTLLDISDSQLALDRDVCDRHALDVRIEQGSMTDLARFDPSSFDLILNPVSNPYISDVRQAWREAARVLAPGGRLIAGSINPLAYLFEENEGEDGKGLEVVHELPYVESESLGEHDLQLAVGREMVFTWSHSLEDIIQGQIDAGLVIAGLFESRRTDSRAPSINRYSPTYIVTLALNGRRTVPASERGPSLSS